MTKNKSYLCQVETCGNRTKIQKVHVIRGVDQNNTPKLKQIDARKFSRQINKSQLVIN